MKNTFEVRTQGISMILAPLLFSVSTFHWTDGEYGINSGTFLILSMVFWIPSFIGLFGLLKDKLPGYSSIGLILTIYGCIGGSNFGFEGIYSNVFDIPHEETLAKFAEYPTQFNFTLFWPGPLFPLSLLVF